MTNTATVDGENLNDTNPDNNIDTAEVSISSLVLLSSLTKPPAAPTPNAPASSTPNELAMTDSAPMARTGIEVVTWLMFAAALVLGGSGLLTVNRRRRS